MEAAGRRLAFPEYFSKFPRGFFQKVQAYKQCPLGLQAMQPLVHITWT